MPIEKKNHSPKAGQFATEIRSILDATRRAQRVLQVRIDLEHFTLKLRAAHIDEGGRHRFEIRITIVERYARRSQRIFVLIGIDSY